MREDMFGVEEKRVIFDANSLYKENWIFTNVVWKLWLEVLAEDFF